jgi:hypothetical protein
MLSLLAANAAAPATARLLELALWEVPAVRRCHAPLLVLALLVSHAEALLQCAPADLATALANLRVETPLDAARLHRRAVHAAATTPHILLDYLDAAWCASAVPSPPFVCAWLDAAEIGTGAAAIGRMWVVDLRSLDEFDAAHFALTSHLPPAEARSPLVREAARNELMDVCNEGGFGLAFVTSKAPLEMRKGSESTLSLDELRMVVHEFAAAGFKRVGVLHGGVASLSAEQQAALVSSGEGVLPPSRDSATAANPAAAAAAAVGRLGQRMTSMKDRISFTRKRAKSQPL